MLCITNKARNKDWEDVAFITGRYRGSCYTLSSGDVFVPSILIIQTLPYLPVTVAKYASFYQFVVQ